MKFNRILISLVFITLVIAALAKKATIERRSHTRAPATFYEVNYPYQTSAGGNIFYMDRNMCSCNSGAISYFQIQRSGDNLRYYSTCPKSSAITGPVMIKYTNYNATNGDKSVNFLDRHNMVCPANHVLRNFKLERNPSSMSRIRYKYTCVQANVLCCKKKTSSKQSMGNKTTFYLDRQQIGDPKSTSRALGQLRLRTSYGPDRMWYEFHMCELMDMDAHAAMTASQAALKVANDGLVAAGTEQQAAKGAQQAVQKQIEDLQVQLKAATDALEAADAKVQAATAASTGAATTLTAAASHQGLKCSS
jgi:hypothetical protein